MNKLNYGNLFIILYELINKQLDKTIINSRACFIKKRFWDNKKLFISGLI